MIYATIEIYLEIPPEIGKKVGIYFYENTPSEIDLPLQKFSNGNRIVQVLFM